ncbi:MAG: monovalent cation/H+ antiporter subunit D [Sulfurospirillaceae bacterium]|jgi:multicomponent K+:H+ antiporter subunit D|nr:monovalent cation/H+ antiporter subunit D [Sulfurospirillaceae bacterium]MDY0237491.1 monovalent cation/H+ antiporter subunit D [Campylobacterales bacterium]NLN00124.1 monovalent cation/H+ antiporter subunit D [Campylobacteraceae bacterium]
MSHISILPIIIPLFGAVAVLFSKVLNRQTQRTLSITLIFILLAVNVMNLINTIKFGYFVYQLGNWPAPFGITLVLDNLSASMVFLTSILALGALWYSIARNIDGAGEHFHVLFQLQLFGINGAFLTGDVFNLFVFFEVLLLASYALILHGNGKERTKYGLHYVIINLVGSSLFLFGVGALYGVLGTLNIADLALEVSKLAPENNGVVAAAGLLLLLVFGLKAAMFPLYLWLPGAYSKTSAPVAALFAIMTKVGIYAIIRIHGTIFGQEAGILSYYHLPWVLGFGLLTLLLGTVGVMASTRLKEQVAYLVLTSIATLLIAVGINSEEALSGALYYMFHSTIIAGGFFIFADTLSLLREEFKDNIIKTPLFKSMILSGSLYFLYAIAIAGMPPLSGFFGKLMILSGVMEKGYAWLVFTIVLFTSLCIIVSLTKSGSQIFYDSDKSTAPLRKKISMRIFYPSFYFLALSFILVVLANPISSFTDTTATMIFNVKEYIQAVEVF